MPTIIEMLSAGNLVENHKPWPRAVVDAQTWTFVSEQLAAGHVSLLGLWADRDAAHMALFDKLSDDIGVITLNCSDGRYPSVGRHHSPAIRLERTIHDLYGLEPVGLIDTRAWIDHGHWNVSRPLSTSDAGSTRAETYAFLPATGEGLHQIPVGPVHASIIEPGHFRFTANGETVVRLEERLGYVHKGVGRLMSGAELSRGSALAGRVSGDSTVAYAYAFARAAECALDLSIPARAVSLRALMAELERLANHIGDVGAICNDASFALMHAHCGVLRERVLRTSNACFGHRLMRDCIVPGGTAVDLDAKNISLLKALIAEIQNRWPKLAELYDDTASLMDRTVGAGILTQALAQRYGAGGYIGRASGRTFDARRSLAYAPYNDLAFDVPVLTAGDVNARVWIRIREVEQSIRLITQIIERLPDGPVQTDIVDGGGLREGMALVESFRGDVMVWLRLGVEGKIERCHLRDPSWFQWPLLEAAIEGNIVADFPLCNKSFNCSYSGHDL